MTRFPLSIAQQGLWFLSQVDSATSAAYNMVFAFETSVAVDRVLLAEAFRLLACRHATLRSHIVTEAGVPAIQVSDREHTLALPIRDAAASLQQVALDESATVVDLARPPLCRAVLVGGAAQDGSGQGLVFTFAHLLFDDGSAAIFFDELSLAYSALAEGSVPQLTGAAGGHAAALRCEQDFLAGAAGQRAIRDALERLHGMPGRLALPRERPLPSGHLVYRAAVANVTLGSETVAAVTACARQLRVTPAAVYLGIFHILLWHYSGQDDFGTSIPVTNRAAVELEHCLGYLTNLGIVRSGVRASGSMASCIDAVADQLMELIEAPALPFPVLAKQLTRSGTDIQGPLLQIGFNYMRSKARTWQFGGSTLAAVDVAPRYAKNELKLDVHESGGIARAWFLYDESGFDAGQIARMGAHFQYLLASFLGQPQTPLRDLPRTAPCERQLLLAGASRTPAPLADRVALHVLFERQAARAAGAVALVHGAEQLSYGELNVRANQLAHRLRTLGVQTSTLVAISIAPCLEMVVAILAVLKAGGAYVPIAPGTPAERLAFVLNDTAAAVLLTQQAGSGRPAGLACAVICVDADWPLVAGYPTQNPDTSVHPGDLAYVIYTSGSTGTPKGVQVEHRQVTRLLEAAATRFDFNSADVWTLFHSFAFDFSVWELWGALSCGARAVIVPHEVSRSPREFACMLERDGVTVLNQTPSAFEVLMQELAPNAANLHLRYIIFGGEALRFACLGPWYAAVGDAGPRLVNMYGITETTVHVTWQLLEPMHAAQSSNLIGAPLDDLAVYLLGPDNELVPIGATGDIHVAGPGLARGYLNRPDLTAASFLPNPFDGRGERMYRTGDLGRYRADGTLEYIGRRDNQVKIRGYRIELGEIENALLGCAGVCAAAVTVSEDAGGAKQLVAYLATTAPGGLAIDALHASLRRTLPDYMLPASWVFLDALPLTTNGKIDRQALPPPASARAASDSVYRAPATPTEQLLASIWADVLQRERIGIDDNFFVLGGHSLLAAQVSARTADQLGCAISVRLLFDAPTVALLAQQVDALPRPAPGYGPASAPIPRRARPGR